MNKKYITILCFVLVYLSYCTGRQCSIGCINCSQDFVCISCGTGTFLRLGQCVPCPYFCKACDNNGICTQCKQGILNNGKCLLCSKNCYNSTSCNNSPTNCTACLAPLVLNSNKCILNTNCPVWNCLSCSSASVSNTSPICQSCSQKYFTWNNNCNLCPHPIKQCSLDNSIIFSIAVTNFITYHFNQVYPLNNTPDMSSYTRWQRQNIFQMYIIQNIINQTTSSLINNITTILSNINVLVNYTINPKKLTPSDKTTLLSLVPSYAAYTNNRINNLIINIIRTTDYLTVNACNDGFYGSICDKCSNGCKECANSSVCTECFSGFWLNGGICEIPTSSCATGSTTNKTCLVCYLPYHLNSSNICISCTVENCETCSDTGTQCKTCLSPYSRLPNTNTGNCYQCNQFSCYHCSQTNISQCLICKSGYTLLSKVCVSCPSKCATCIADNTSNLYTCKECFKSYALIGNNCVACGSGCLVCSNFNTQICFECAQGLFISRSNTCQSCPFGCLQCTDIDGICLKYKPGFAVYNNLTLFCLIGCNICSSSNPNTCLQCNIGNYLSNGVCNKCPIYCLTCTSATTCSQCVQNTHLFNNTCLLCQGNCLTCLSDLVTCQACVKGYKLDNTRRCSISCARGCSLCENATQCMICNQGYSLNNVGKCIKCLVGCSGNCNPTNITQCYDCNYGYEFVGSTCVKCPAGCQTCFSSICTSCFQGFQLTQNGNNIICKQKCNFPCKKCDVNGCIQCQNWYGITSTSGGICQFNPNSCNSSCDICPAGSYRSNSGECYPCQTNGCANCQSTNSNQNGICQTCTDGFFYNFTACVPCRNNCRLCSSEYNCIKCGIGYTNAIITVNDVNTASSFSLQCLPCNSKCQSCSISVDHCQTCIDQYVLKDSQCFGRNHVRFKLKFDKNFIQFLNAAESQTILANIAIILQIDINNIILTSLTNGSTIVQGSVSASSNQQAISLSNQLYDAISTNKNILGFMVSQIKVAAYYDDNKNYDSSNFRGLASNIIGISTTFGCLILIISLICCINNRVRDPKQKYSDTNSSKQAVEIHYQKRVAEQNYNIEFGSIDKSLEQVTLNQLKQV